MLLFIALNCRHVFNIEFLTTGSVIILFLE